MTSRQPTFEAITPDSYLEFADELSSSSKPAHLRTAADRTYYGAFLTCRDKLKDKGYITPYNSSDDHKYVADTLKDLLGSIGNDEQRIRQLRNKVTYDTRSIDSASLQWMIDTARSIIEKVDALPASGR